MEKSKISDYEGSQHKPYEQLGIEKEKSWDSWGNVIVTKPDGTSERKSFYSDETITQRLFTDEIIGYLSKQTELSSSRVIVDFGGAEGTLLHQIVEQVKSKFPEIQIDPVVIDADPKKVEEVKKYPELKSVEGDIFKIPLSDNSVDVAVSRMMMQYLPPINPELPKQTQETTLEEMYRVMKPGSIIQIVWPAVYDFTNNSMGANVIDHIWSLITWHRTFNDKEEPGDGKWIEDDSGYPVFSDPNRARSFVPGEVLAKYAERLGFKVKAGGEVDWIEFRFTPEAVIERFKVEDTERQDLIKGVFNFLKGRWGIDVIDWKDKKALRLPISRLVLEK